VTKESQLPPFRYFDKGNPAVVVKNFAVLQSGCVMMSGLLAWLIWVLIYIPFLAEDSLRFSDFFQCVWTYLSATRGCLGALLTANLRHQLNIMLET
jgi:NADH dehydrogenase